MLGATDTKIFERGGYQGTKLANGPPADSAEVARDGWWAMLAGEASVISADRARVLAADMRTKDPQQVAREHARVTRPGPANSADPSG